METDMERKAIWDRETAAESARVGQDSAPPPSSDTYITPFLPARLCCCLLTLLLLLLLGSAPSLLPLPPSLSWIYCLTSALVVLRSLLCSRITQF